MAFRWFIYLTKRCPFSCSLAKYWNEYVEQSELLNDDLTDNISEVQEAIVAAPKYDSSTRGSRKYNDEMDQRLNQILDLEDRKVRLLGPHKQKLTRLQIFMAV